MSNIKNIPVNSTEAATNKQTELTFDELKLVNTLLKKPRTPESAFTKTVRFEGKYARMLDHYFPGRTGLSMDFLINAIDHYVKIESGCTIDEYGKFVNLKQTELPLKEDQEGGLSN